MSALPDCTADHHTRPDALTNPQLPGQAGPESDLSAVEARAGLTREPDH